MTKCTAINKTIKVIMWLYDLLPASGWQQMGAAKSEVLVHARVFNENRFPSLISATTSWKRERERADKEVKEKGMWMQVLLDLLQAGGCSRHFQELPCCSLPLALGSRRQRDTNMRQTVEQLVNWSKVDQEMAVEAPVFFFFLLPSFYGF